MKIHNFINKPIEPINFGRNTVMVMSFIPVALEFENSKELKEFCRVWEDSIEPKVSELSKESVSVAENYPDYIVGWYVDAFEEESLMYDDEENEARNLCLVKIDAPDSDFDDTVATYFGVLNGKDIFTGLDVLEKHSNLLESFLEDEEMAKDYDIETLKMLSQINMAWKMNIIASNNPRRQYFKVEVTE